jgi:hypothetical protein
MLTDYIFPPMLTKQTCLVGVLQQLQAMIMLVEPKKNVTLADVAQFVQTAQLDFGSDAELEHVIQKLVVRDLERQLHERSQRTTIQGS